MNTETMTFNQALTLTQDAISHLLTGLPELASFDSGEVQTAWQMIFDEAHAAHKTGSFSALALGQWALLELQYRITNQTSRISKSQRGSLSLAAAQLEILTHTLTEFEAVAEAAFEKEAK